MIRVVHEQICIQSMKKNNSEFESEFWITIENDDFRYISID